MKKLMLLVSVFALAGCGPDLEAACTNYIDAYDACAATAYGDSTYDLDSESTCSVYDGVTGAAAQTDADYLQCLADAYNSGDCSTPEGMAAIDISGCTL